MKIQLWECLSILKLCFWKSGMGFIPQSKNSGSSKHFSTITENQLIEKSEQPVVSCFYYMKKGHSVRFCKILKFSIPKVGSQDSLRFLTIKLTSMDPNLLRDQILPPDFNFCRISWWKISTYGTWTVTAPSTWLEMFQSLSTLFLSRKAMWPMGIITKERSLEKVRLVMKTIFWFMMSSMWKVSLVQKGKTSATILNLQERLYSRIWSACILKSKRYKCVCIATFVNTI